MMKPPSSAPTASVARSEPSNSSNRSSCPSLSQRINRRGDWADDLPQSLQVPVDVLGGARGKRCSVSPSDTATRARTGQPRPPCSWIDQQVLARRRFFSHAAGDFEMMRGIAQARFDFALDGRFLIRDDDRIGGQEVQQVAASRRRRSRRRELFRFYGKHGHAIERVARALRIEVEAAHRSDLVAPPLDAGRRRHANP